MSPVLSNWKDSLKQKVASAQPRADEEVAEAFAQQAYVAVGNRDKAIMRDPHLLGFEVLENNEDNTRLLGAFAFRVSGEILLVPVFFLNGVIKGHQMLYRKGVKRFCPNNEKWVNHLLSRDEDDEGTVIDRNARQGRLHLPLSRLTGKMASVDIDAEIGEALHGINATAAQWEQWEKEAAEFSKQANPARAAQGALGVGASAMHSPALKGLGEASFRKDIAGPLLDMLRANPRKTMAAATVAATPMAVGGLADKARGVKDYLTGDDLQRDITASKGQAAELKGQIADSKTPATPEVSPEGGKITDQLMKHLHNPLVLGGLALGIPTTAVLASMWNERRKKNKGVPVAAEDAEGDEELKAASASNPWLIKHLWKEAMEEWKVTPPEHLFADVIGRGCQKQAAELARRMPRFAEWIVMADSLAHAKVAHEILPEPVLTYFTSPPSGASEAEVSSFYKRGYAIDDRRTDKEVRQRLVTAETELSLSNSGAAGTRMLFTPDGPIKALWGQVRDYDDSGAICCFSSHGGSSSNYQLVTLEGKHSGCSKRFTHQTDSRYGNTALPLFLDNVKVEEYTKSAKPKKGGHYLLWCDGGFLNSHPLEVKSLETSDGITRINLEQSWGDKVVINPELETPQKVGGILYVGPSCKFVELKTESKGHDCDYAPVKALPEIWITRENVQGTILGNIHKVKFAKQGSLYELTVDGTVVGRDLTEGQLAIKMACFAKLATADVLDVIDNQICEFDTIDPLPEKQAAPSLDEIRRQFDPTWKDVAEPAGKLFDRVSDKYPGLSSLSRDPGTGEITGFNYSETSGGKDTASAPSTPQGDLQGMDWKGMLTHPATLVAGGLGAGALTTWLVQKALQRKSRGEELSEEEETALAQAVAKEKSSSAYFDRDIDFDAEFGGDESFDPDLLLRMLPAQQNAQVRAIRHQQPAPERRYLDAKGYGGPKNSDHISDQELLSMTDPGNQLAQMGQQLQMGTLIDHGALSALTKVFDIAPFIKEYVGKLEESLDYLARLLFMLFWKPKDFSRQFGEDDLVSLENKLVGVFESYGDIVLELMQSTGDKGSK